MPLKIKNRVDGLANPILVKEMYQSVHSKKFLVAMWLLLVASLFTYVLVYMDAGAGGTCGDTMFGTFSVFTYLMSLCVLPYLAFSTLHEEIKGRTIELIHITRMDSRRHVRGRFLASVVKLGLLFSILAPFTVAAFLFKGVAVETILIVLYIFFCSSLVACAVGIFFGSLTSVDRLQTVARWTYLVLLAFTLFGGPYVVGVGFMAGPMGFSFTAFRGEILIGLGLYTLFVLLGVWFLCAAAANLLTFEADKSSGRTKLILVFIALAALAVPFTSLLLGGTPDIEVILAVVILPAVFLALCSFLWLTDKERVSRRRQKKLEKHGILYRLIFYPFTDGPGSSAVFLALICLLMAFSALLLLQDSGHRAGTIADARQYILYPVVVVFVYALFFSALTWIIARMLPARMRTATARRVIILSLVVLNCIVGVLVVVATGFGQAELRNPLTSLFPMLYLLMLDDPNFAGAYGDLAIPALVGMIVHGRLLFGHLRRYLRGDYD